MTRNLIQRRLKIVAVSPHADDVEYGLGALLAGQALRGSQLTIALMTGANETRTTEAKAAADVLGADLVADPTGHDGSLEISSARVRWLEQLVIDADLVFAPHPDDTHQDHRAVSAITSTALRRSAVGLAWYRTPSSGSAFTPTAFSAVTRYTAQRRELAIAMHDSQAARTYLSREHLALKDAWYGWLSGQNAAEPFQVVKYQFDRPPCPTTGVGA
jgi:LmbE family N-acetylglucosaminyl deacetylase